MEYTLPRYEAARQTEQQWIAEVLALALEWQRIETAYATYDEEDETSEPIAYERVREAKSLVLYRLPSERVVRLLQLAQLAGEREG